MSQLQLKRSNSSNITSITGHHAPSTGWWRPQDDLPVRYLQRGDIMPAFEGSQTVWTLIRPDMPSARVKSQEPRS